MSSIRIYIFLLENPENAQKCFSQKVPPIWRRAFFSLSLLLGSKLFDIQYELYGIIRHITDFRSTPTTTVFDLIYILPCWIQLNPITERSPAQMHSNWDRSGSTGFDFEPPKNLLGWVTGCRQNSLEMFCHCSKTFGLKQSSKKNIIIGIIIH